MLPEKIVNVFEIVSISGRTTAVVRLHSSWYAHAHHLLCMRWPTVMRQLHLDLRRTFFVIWYIQNGVYLLKRIPKGSIGWFFHSSKKAAWRNRFSENRELIYPEFCPDISYGLGIMYVVWPYKRWSDNLWYIKKPWAGNYHNNLERFTKEVWISPVTVFVLGKYPKLSNVNHFAIRVIYWCKHCYSPSSMFTKVALGKWCIKFELANAFDFFKPNALQLGRPTYEQNLSIG